MRTQPQGDRRRTRQVRHRASLKSLEPQVRAATVGHVAAAGSLGRPPRLQGEDGVDGTTLCHLLEKSLALKKKKEKEEEEELRLLAVPPQLHALPGSSSPGSRSSWALTPPNWRAGGRGRRKRKKKLPRKSSASRWLRVWVSHMKSTATDGSLCALACQLDSWVQLMRQSSVAVQVISLACPVNGVEAVNGSVVGNLLEEPSASMAAALSGRRLQACFRVASTAKKIIRASDFSHNE